MTHAPCPSVFMHRAKCARLSGSSCSDALSLCVKADVRIFVPRRMRVSVPTRCHRLQSRPTLSILPPQRAKPTGHLTVAHSAEGDELPILGDWRDFRAKLILQQGGQPATARQSEENVRLLEIQNPTLAAEGIWAHPTTSPEQGGVLVASLNAAKVLKDDLYWQVVIFIMQHSADQGTVGLILNRPSALVLGYGKPRGLPFKISNTSMDLQQVFSDNRVYCGGKTAQGVIHLLHGHKLPRSVEVVPGIYAGGDVAATKEVTADRLSADDFKFFSGAVVWEPGQLEEEIAEGVWYPAACSRSLVLKPCLQLPTPLWREVLHLMGGKYVDVAKEGYEGDE